MSPFLDLLLSGLLGSTPIIESPIEELPIMETTEIEMIELSPIEEAEFLDLIESLEPATTEMLPPAFPENFDSLEFDDQEEISLEQLDQEQTEFLNSFSEAVTSGNINETLDHIDWIYKEDQLDYIHEGDEKQFLDELFCGQVTIIDEFKCMPFQEIKDLKDYNREVINPDAFYLTEVDFLISDGATKITQQMDLYRDSNNPKIYGVYGSEG